MYTDRSGNAYVVVRPTDVYYLKLVNIRPDAVNRLSSPTSDST